VDFVSETHDHRHKYQGKQTHGAGNHDNPRKPRVLAPSPDSNDQPYGPNNEYRQ